MGDRGPTQLALTPKGVEELTLRTHRLDPRLRNILFLIQKGTPTLEAILQNSIFPHEEVIEKLRGLVKDRFVELVSGLSPSSAQPKSRNTINGAPRSEAADIAPEAASVPAIPARLAPQTVAPAFPSLDSGISMSQARFLLCDFCLDQFGTNAQPLLDAIEDAGDVDALQNVLDGLTAQMRKHQKQKLPELIAKVHEINETAL
jgi:hypothetical protein